jgi:class 3 adenylate cyclase
MNTPCVVVREPGRTPLHLLVVDSLEVGRDCGGVLIADPGVSRRHLSLQRDGDGLKVADLGSTNGTTLDGTVISTTPCVLGAGQVVRLGATTIELYELEPSSSEVSPDDLRAHDPRATSIDLVAAAVQHDRLSLPVAHNGTVTIVFSDIEGSTERAVELGDAAWMTVLNVHNSIIRRQVERHGGTEVKSQGDGFMLAFSSARAAIDAMAESQRALSAWASSHPATAVRVRIGIHTGEAIVRHDDFHGRHVVIAARVASVATGGEILVSSLVRQIVETRGDLRFGPERVVTLKGLADEWRVSPVIWAS